MRTTSFNGTRKTAVISNNRTGIIADSKGYISIFDANKIFNKLISLVSNVLNK